MSWQMQTMTGCSVSDCLLVARRVLAALKSLLYSIVSKPLVYMVLVPSARRVASLAPARTESNL